MEELIILIVRLIERWMSPQQSASPRKVIPRQPPALPPGTAPVRSVKAPARRGRRAVPAVAIAAPIITGLLEPTPAPMPPVVPMQRAQAKAIVSKADAKAAPALDAATLRRWLLPTTLRQQYLLTEIFQPPLALRDERRW